MRVEYRSEPEYIEYLDGEAHPKVSPRIPHGAVQARLAMFLQQMAPSPHIIATEGDAAVNNDEGRYTKLIPDISFFWRVDFRKLRLSHTRLTARLDGSKNRTALRMSRSHGLPSSCAISSAFSIPSRIG